MALSTFVPQLWSARLLAHLDKNLILGNLVNHDYEGEIANYGDTVKINQISDIAVKDYVKGTDLVYDDTDGTPTELTIDQQKYFAFKVEDIDTAQANISLVDRAMDRASYKLRDSVDQHVAAHSAQAGIQIASTALTTPESAYDAMVALAVAFDQENVPDAGRWVVVPPWVYGLILKDSRFVASGVQSAADALQSGRIGGAANFTVYKSNNLVYDNTAKTYSIMAGTNAAITLARQIIKTEPLRLQNSFSDAVRGLLVYGSSVIQPKALACLKVTEKAAG